MNPIYYFVMMLAPLIGGLGGIYMSKGDRSLLKIFMAFSGAYLFSVSVISLIPEIYEKIPGKIAGIGILAGFLIQLVIEQFSHGVENGHIHEGKNNHLHQHDHSLPLGIFISLSFHSFLEGMPLGGIVFSDPKTFFTLLGGISLHEIPASFALMTVFRHQIGNPKKTLIWLFLYSIMAPAGALLAFNFKQMAFPASYMSVLMAVVVGFFLHISTTILFENSENHLYNKIKLLAIGVGVSLACIMQF